jgi:hypothetical protein
VVGYALEIQPLAAPAGAAGVPLQEARELYVLCVGCQTITGAFDWKGVQLRVTQEISPQGEARYWFRDEVGFALSCNGGVVVSAGIPGAEWLSSFAHTTEVF